MWIVTWDLMFSIVSSPIDDQRGQERPIEHRGRERAEARKPNDERRLPHEGMSRERDAVYTATRRSITVAISAPRYV